MLPVLRNHGMTLPEAFDLVDREFGRMVGRLRGNGGAELAVTYPADIWEDDDNVYVEAEIPGFGKDDIDITLEKGTLQISASRQIEERNGTHVSERKYTRYFRSFTLPIAVEEDKIEATVNNGVLHLTLPKRAEVKPKKVKIQ